MTFVDGINDKSTTMDYELACPVVSQSSLYLGHSVSVNQQLPHNLHCQLGNVFLFNGIGSFCFTSIGPLWFFGLLRRF